MVEDYCKMFPSMLFLRPDYSPMHFVLCLKNEVTEDLEEVMQHCGAEISHGLQEATPYSIVIVDHNNIVNFDGPAFSIEYVHDCLKELRVLDIAGYKQKATKHPAAGDDCMDVVYFQTKTWDDIPENSTSSQESNHISNAVNNNDEEAQRYSGLTDDDKLSADFDLYNDGPVTSTQVEEDSDETKSDVSDSLIQPMRDSQETMTSEAAKMNYKNDSGLERNERILELMGHEDEDKSDDGEEEEVTQSGQLSKESSPVKNIASPEKSTRARRRLLNLEPAGLEDEDENGEEEEVTHSGHWLSKQSSSPVRKTRAKKQPLQIRRDFSSCEDSDKARTKATSSKPSFRQPYTIEERCEILKYIVARDEYSRVKGNMMWKIMERKKLLPHRTWQSMREHFLKKIVLDLSPYSFLTESQKRKLKQLGI